MLISQTYVYMTFTNVDTIIIIIEALSFDDDHVTYIGDFQRVINEAIYI